MSANMRKLMREVPRPLEVQARDSKDQLPIGRKKVSPARQAEQAEPLMAMIANGEIQLDEHSAKLVASYLEHHHARAQRH